jgi:hypothetical protein
MEATIIINEKGLKTADPTAEQFKRVSEEVRTRTSRHGTMYQIIEDGLEYKEGDLLAAMDNDRKLKSACEADCECCRTCSHCTRRLKKTSSLKKHQATPRCQKKRVPRREQAVSVRRDSEKSDGRRRVAEPHLCRRRNLKGCVWRSYSLPTHRSLSLPPPHPLSPPPPPHSFTGPPRPHTHSWLFV